MNKPIIDNVIPIYAMYDISCGSLDAVPFAEKLDPGPEEFPDGLLVGLPPPS
jgi:hypothetical protein